MRVLCTVQWQPGCCPKILNYLCLTEKRFRPQKNSRGLNFLWLIKTILVSGLIFLARPPSLIAQCLRDLAGVYCKGFGLVERRQNRKDDIEKSLS